MRTGNGGAGEGDGAPATAERARVMMIEPLRRLLILLWRNGGDGTNMQQVIDRLPTADRRRRWSVWWRRQSDDLPILSTPQQRWHDGLQGWCSLCFYYILNHLPLYLRTHNHRTHPHPHPRRRLPRLRRRHPHIGGRADRTRVRRRTAPTAVRAVRSREAHAGILRRRGRCASQCPRGRR